MCLVVGVADGDTLTVRCGDGPGAYEQVKIRLAEIDAPERKQPFGTVSRQHLADLCFQRLASIKTQKKDRYGRTIARVNCDNKDASVEQVRAGMAWAYTKYLTDPVFRELEATAASAKAGLWRDVHPIPPWEWRKGVRYSPTVQSDATHFGAQSAETEPSVLTKQR